jgi:signal peptidase
VLPNLSWAFTALVGTAVPVIGMVLVNSYYTGEASMGVPRAHREEGSPGGWIATGVVAVVTIWFAVGLFPVQPVLVASGSMRPELDVGDVALIAKVSPARIQPGDVIQFRTVGQGPVIHRVIGVDNTGSPTRFLTQGDANDSPDQEPVLADNVVGKHVFTVRDIGWISVAVKELFVNRSG